MRYSITINQLALHNLKSKINSEEAILLDYLFWLCTSVSEEVEKMRIEIDGKKYTWFDYGYYIKQTPILRGKSKATITPKIKKLMKEEFIDAKDYAKKGDACSRKYIRLLPKVDGLFRKLNEVVKKTKRGSFRKLNIDNTINIDNNNKDNIEASASMGKQVNDLIDLFKEVNPSHQRLFGMKSQRDAMERLLKKYSYEKVEKMINTLPQIIDKPYAPQITTPYQLEQKLGNLFAYVKREKVKSEKSRVVSI